MDAGRLDSGLRRNDGARMTAGVNPHDWMRWLSFRAGTLAMPSPLMGGWRLAYDRRRVRDGGVSFRVVGAADGCSRQVRFRLAPE